MSIRLKRKEIASTLLTSVMENRESEWWKEKTYRGRYTLEETERALDILYSVFDDDWLKHTLDMWTKQGGPSHALIGMLVPRGSMPLISLVELGKDLTELRDLVKYDELIKELRTPSKFKAACLESEIAAYCLRSEYSVELHPRVRGKVPDLRISTDSEVVFAEVKEMDPGEVLTRYYETADLVSQLVLHGIPRGTSVEVSTDVLPNRSECIPLAQAIHQCLHSRPRDGVASVKLGRVNALISFGKEAYPSFSLIPPTTLPQVQLKRLSRSIKHEARQIPPPDKGFVVVDAGTLHGLPDKMVREVAVKTFKKYRLPNIVMAMIVRSYRFWRPKTEAEAIGISNPYCTDVELLTRLNKILAFSRFRAHSKEKETRGVVFS